MNIKVSKSNDKHNLDKVCTNFIYNRYDLFCNENSYELVQIKNGNEEKYIEYRIMDNQIELGLWLTPITLAELERLILHVHKQHPDIPKITYRNGVLPYGKAVRSNHFRIIFPDTVEEMENTLTTKSRYKMRKKLRFAAEKYGEMKYLEYSYNDIPEEIVEKFFDFKYRTYNRSYNMTSKEYLERYHVSHCYVLMFGDTVGAIRFSCEQCPIVYGENFSYNPELKDYSLGKAIFFYHLIRMVEKKHPELFFAGGNFEYKKHFGSIEEDIYNCTILTNELKFETILTRKDLIRKCKTWIKKRLPKKFIKKIKKIKRKIKKTLK